MYIYIPFLRAVQTCSADYSGLHLDTASITVVIWTILFCSNQHKGGSNIYTKLSADLGKASCCSVNTVVLNLLSC